MASFVPIHTCINCGSTTLDSDRKFKLCSGCKMMRYCSKECQRQHWPQHKNICSDSEALAIYARTRAIYDKAYASLSKPIVMAHFMMQIKESGISNPIIDIFLVEGEHITDCKANVLNIDSLHDHDRATVTDLQHKLSGTRNIFIRFNIQSEKGLWTSITAISNSNPL